MECQERAGERGGARRSGAGDQRPAGESGGEGDAWPSGGKRGRGSLQNCLVRLAPGSKRVRFSNLNARPLFESHRRPNPPGHEKRTGPRVGERGAIAASRIGRGCGSQAGSGPGHRCRFRAPARWRSGAGISLLRVIYAVGGTRFSTLRAVRVFGATSAARQRRPVPACAGLKGPSGRTGERSPGTTTTIGRTGQRSLPGGAVHREHPPGGGCHGERAVSLPVGFRPIWAEVR